MAEAPVQRAEIDDAHYAAIGRVAEGWASLEFLMDLTCWDLAQVEGRVGSCLTSQVMGHARKLDALLALVRFRGGSHELVRRLNKFCVGAQSVADRRNRIVHDPWQALGDTPHRLEITARKVPILAEVPMTTHEVMEVCHKIDELWTELNSIRDEALGLVREN